MKKVILLLICLSFATQVSAQKKAVTEQGEEVILYEDGTWKFVNPDELLITEIPTNPAAFKKSEDASFLLKSTRLNLGFYINPKVWSFHKAVDNPEAEYELSLKGGDLYGSIITEKIEVPLETLKFIALENGKSIAPDFRVIKEEYRMVNDLKILFLQMDGTMQGIKFSYYGYYYSSPSGTVQFITYTSQNLLDDYRNDCDTLLNGLVELDKS